MMMDIQFMLEFPKRPPKVMLVLLEEQTVWISGVELHCGIRVTPKEELCSTEDISIHQVPPPFSASK